MSDDEKPADKIVQVGTSMYSVGDRGPFFTDAATEPTAIPPGEFLWVDEDGKVWRRLSDGSNVPFPGWRRE